MICTLILALAGLGTAAEPILEWRFDGQASAGGWQGRFGSPTKGPQAPKYPGFDTNNMAMPITGHEGSILIKDHERGGFTNIRFGKGDTFAFEAWVKFKSIGKGHMVYVIGKGRHGKLGESLGEMNQNYAVRLQGTGAGAKLGFLFTSQDPKTKKRDWHRWWSKAEVPVTGWHHVAVQFTFGKADSLLAYIDSRPVTGVWDMGGATDLPPVQDVDDLVIGTGQSRSAGQSFQGWLDNVAIYRFALDPKELATRYKYVPPPPQITRKMVPAGKVLVQISEKGVPESNAWPEEPEVTESYQEDVFGFFELPHKYISTGVRGDRANPSHVRASALVKLPKGKHRLLLRGRGTSRLFIDGKKTIETTARPTDPGGHGLVSEQDEYLDLGPDFRFAPPGNRDAWCEFETPGGEHFVILETMRGNIVGKNKQRPELGETVVAVSLQGSKTWSLLSPGKRQVAYNDVGWAAYEAERRARLARVNAKARAERRAANDDYWSRRRTAAAKWLAKTKKVNVPDLPKGYPANNDIDRFIGPGLRASRRSHIREARPAPITSRKCSPCWRGAAMTAIRAARRRAACGSMTTIPCSGEASPMAPPSFRARRVKAL